MLTIAIAFIISRSVVMPTSDVAWLTLAAERLLNGQHFGNDIYELNSPFALLIYLPSVFMHQFFSFSPFFTTYTLTTILILLCIGIAASILKNRDYPLFYHPEKLWIFRISFLVAYLLIPGLNGFAQRDHIIACLLLPYALLKLAPSGYKEGIGENKHFINLLSSFLFSLALIIKPQYIIFSILLNFYILFREGRFKLYLPGLMLTAFMLSISGLITVIFFTPWLSIAYTAYITYQGYQHPIKAVANALLQLLNVAVTFIFFTHSALPKPSNKLEFPQQNPFLSLGIIGILNIPLYLISKNGWYYHALSILLPLYGITFYAAYYYCLRFKKIVLWGLSTALLSMSHLLLLYNAKKYYEVPLPESMYSQIKKGDSFLCISPDIQCAFPRAVTYGYHYVSRYPSLWPSGGALTLFELGKIDETTLHKYLDHDIKNTTEDILKYQPKLIAVQWHQEKNGTIRFFEKDPQFNLALSHYRLFNKTDITQKFSIWIYVKK